MIDVKEEIESAIDYQKSIIPNEIKELIGKARHDLYYGPSYYDDEGNELTCFDENAKPFNFQSAVKKISEYIMEISDIDVIRYTEDEDGQEIEYTERIENSAQAIIEALCGKELTKYL